MSAARAWLITGAAGGLGRSLCRAAVAAGDTVICAARQRRQLDGLRGELGSRAIPLQLDIADPDSIAIALQDLAPVDVLVNCAGTNVIAPAEEIATQTARQIMNVNFFGAFDVMRALLPRMRSRRSGTIVNVSSMGGIVGVEGLALYSASKFALEGFSEALAAEVRPFGIRVHVVEPGPFRTPFRSRSMAKPPQIADYRESFGPVWEKLNAGTGSQAGDPDRAAAAILTLVDAPDAPFRLPLGAEAVDAIRAKLASVENELDRWEGLARSTAFQ